MNAILDSVRRHMPTPRTDAAASRMGFADMAKMEIELQAMTAQRDTLRDALTCALPMMDDAAQDANERAGTGELIVRARWQVAALLFKRQAEDARKLITETGGKL